MHAVLIGSSKISGTVIQFEIKKAYAMSELSS